MNPFEESLLQTDRSDREAGRREGQLARDLENGGAAENAVVQILSVVHPRRLVTGTRAVAATLAAAAHRPVTAFRNRGARAVLRPITPPADLPVKP